MFFRARHFHKNSFLSTGYGSFRMRFLTAMTALISQSYQLHGLALYLYRTRCILLCYHLPHFLRSTDRCAVAQYCARSYYKDNISFQFDFNGDCT